MYALNRIREIRKERGLSQKEVYTRLGIKQPQYSRYESGENEMGVSMLKEICKVLDVSADYILGLSDDPTPRARKKEIIKKNKQVNYGGNNYQINN